MKTLLAYYYSNKLIVAMRQSGVMMSDTWPTTCKTPARDVDGTAVQYHSGSRVSSRHAVYEPDDVDSDEYGQ